MSLAEELPRCNGKSGGGGDCENDICNARERARASRHGHEAQGVVVTEALDTESEAAVAEEAEGHHGPLESGRER